MMDVNGFMQVIADTFLGGNVEVAGILIFVAVLMVLMALTKDIMRSMIVGLPAVLIFSALGILSTDMMILMIIVMVLGIAYTAKHTMEG